MKFYHGPPTSIHVDGPKDVAKAKSFSQKHSL